MSNQLSENQKALIEAEEIYREEVRNDLRSSHRPKGFLLKLFAFFNTSFGIAIWTAILVPASVALYAWRENSYITKRENQLTIQRLDREIAARLIGAEKEVHQSENGRDLKATVRRINSTSRSLLPEYNNRELISVLLDLEILLGKGKEASEEVSNVRRLITTFMDKEFNDEEIQEAKDSINKAFQIRQWGVD